VDAERRFVSFPAPSLPRSFHCANHPDREGVGLCVGCRAVVCVECSTRVDRMNYCIRCLEAARPAGQEVRKENPRAAAAWGIPLLALSFVLAVAVFWALGFLLALVRNWSPGGVGA
jgi:hypothetical protein